MGEELIWKRLYEVRELSNCLKTKTAAALVKDGIILSVGPNSCAPEGYNYGDKIERCPRENVPTGIGYELCKPVHAEVMAPLNIRPNRSLDEIGRYASHLLPQVSDQYFLDAFVPEELEKIHGSKLYLLGHYWACDTCKRFTSLIGVADIIFNKFSADQVLKRYSENKIT